MGCCQSNKNVPKMPPKPTTPHTPSQDLPESEDRAPPPSPPPALMEEETVKEVLSETPISKPPSKIIPTHINPTREPEMLMLPQAAVKKTTEQAMDLGKPTEEEIVIVSEASELCSFSGSFSTNTVNEKDEEGEVVTQRVGPRTHPKTAGKRSYSGEQNGVRDTRGLRSPAKRNQMTRSRPAQAKATATQQQRNVGPTANGARRDPRVARSRSPASRRDALPGRNVGTKTPGSGITGNLGGRSPGRKDENVEEKLETKLNDDVLGAENSSESIENPHVSLECFIFL